MHKKRPEKTYNIGFLNGGQPELVCFVIKNDCSWVQWLMTVIETAWEAGTERITVQGQTSQKVSKTPISTNKSGLVVHFCNPSCVRGIRKKIMV
jgi:hypothetical protein